MRRVSGGVGRRSGDWRAQRAAELQLGTYAFSPRARGPILAREAILSCVEEEREVEPAVLEVRAGLCDDGSLAHALLDSRTAERVRGRLCAAAVPPPLTLRRSNSAASHIRALQPPAPDGAVRCIQAGPPGGWQGCSQPHLQVRGIVGPSQRCRTRADGPVCTAFSSSHSTAQFGQHILKNPLCVSSKFCSSFWTITLTVGHPQRRARVRPPPPLHLDLLSAAADAGCPVPAESSTKRTCDHPMSCSRSAPVPAT